MVKENSQEATAKSVEEAIELALRELDAARDEVEVEVLSPGKPGLLGFGAEAARVRVTRQGASIRVEDEQLLDDKTATQARNLTQALLDLMKVSAETYVRDPSTPDQTNPIIEVEGEDSGLLIGRRGETLQSLQFLVNYLLRHQVGDHARVIIDVEGYKERRYKAVREMAHRMAERVVSTGRPVTLEPMPPAERRTVHIALAEHHQVATQSTGEGTARQVRIFMK